MSSPTQGLPWTFVAEFFQYPGGPSVDVTNLQFEIVDLTTSTTVLGPTNVGIVHVSTGVYSLVFNVPPNFPLDQYAIIWTSVETTASETFTITSSGSSGVSSGPCAGWDAPIWTCALPVGAAAVTGQAVQAASDVLYALTGRHLGTCQLTIRPCRESCWGNEWPFLQWWQFGLYPRPVFYEGVWYNITCNNCPNGSCSCSVISEALMPAPVAQIMQVKVDGVVLPSTAYRMDNYRLLVRTDGGVWPFCNNLALDDTHTGTWSVTLTTGQEVSTLGRMALGELATQFVKLLLCNSDCLFPKPVQQLVRQGVTMNFLDPNEVFANGKIGLYLCDLFVSVENPNRLMMPSEVYDLDAPSYRITNT
jgi:hypothetical protein